MKYATAKKIMRAASALAEGFPELNIPYDQLKAKTTTKEGQGYMVHYEERRKNILASGYFPDKHAGEPLIADYRDALNIAQLFAACTMGYTHQCICHRSQLRSS